MKGVLLLSGGIDSPVAGYVMMNQGWDVIAVSMDSAMEEGTSLGKLLSLKEWIEAAAGRPMKLYYIPHKGTMGEVTKNCSPTFTCVLCKRMMHRIAARIAQAEGASAIITGDSMGQVASQTLSNISIEDNAEKMPVIRPLIGMDKEEIITIAREAGTFDISITDAPPCPFVPRMPSVKSSLRKILAEEEKIDVGRLVDNAVAAARVFQ
ncbi:MAG: hypothetical protein CVT48_00520 [Thermoplasmata archaeon HGW-Thermoplasmata-1]|nr:MAG: hypothetical protein CVT48_00520 [Thermoplasmata archaeon HGW-Thermoplasmata-1]